MTKLIVETDNNWTKRKIQDVIHTEAELLRKAIQRTQQKIQEFEHKYGSRDRETLYGQVDDMKLLEWEGEIETIEKLQKELQSFEEITFHTAK